MNYKSTNTQPNGNCYLRTVIVIRTVENKKELQQIAALQKKNLFSNIDEHESASQGFLTAEYSLEFLEEMNNMSPAIIAKDSEVLAGYALVTLRQAAHKHPLLEDLFNTIDRIVYKGGSLKESRYVVVGQLCVAREYRGMGLVQRLYNGFREVMSDHFDYCITDVAEANQRSLKAHQKSGFKVIDKLTYGGISWNIVLWDWKEGAAGDSTL